MSGGAPLTGQALAVPATPADAVDGPSGFDPSRVDTVTFARLIGLATDEDLADAGRYFEDSYDDLTKCSHGDTGEYQRSSDGALVQFLWNNRRNLLAIAIEAATAGETGTGSTEGESAGPQDIAQPLSPSPSNTKD